MNNATCKDCVFRGEIAERKQSACGMCGDLTQAVITSVAADFNKFCSNKMTREDVQEMRENVIAMKRERDLALLTLSKADEYIEAVRKLINNLKEGNIIAEGVSDVKKV